MWKKESAGEIEYDVTSRWHEAVNHNRPVRHETYFETATQLESKKSRRSSQRGSSDTTAATACLGMDIDTSLKSDDYPPASDVLEILHELLPPSLIVFSGRGFHPYWIFDQPVLLESNDDRKRFADLLSGWIACVSAEITKLGFAVAHVRLRLILETLRDYRRTREADPNATESE